MKKFEFSLQKLMNYKQQMLEKEKMTLSRLRGEKNAVENRIELLEMQAQQLGEEQNIETRKGTTAQKIQQYRFQISNVHSQVKDLRKELLTLELAVENQQKVVLSFNQEVSGLEKLEEKQVEEHRVKVAKENETFIAELISSKISANMAAAGQRS